MISICNCSNCKHRDDSCVLASMPPMYNCLNKESGKPYVKMTDYCDKWEEKKIDCNWTTTVTSDVETHTLNKCPYANGQIVNCDKKCEECWVYKNKQGKTQLVEPEHLVDLYQMIKDLPKVNLQLTKRVQKLENVASALEGRLDQMDELREPVEPLKDWHEDKWIVHRTSRKQNREIYITSYVNERVEVAKYEFNKNDAMRYIETEAIKIRDELNKDRQGKRYLWVISKVEE